MPPSSITKEGQGPLVLMVLDGWGIRAEREANALALASLPWYNRYIQEYPFTALEASGEAVGLPPGQMGNSEVGHLNIGAGRVVYQELTRIKKAILDGTFDQNPVLLRAMGQAKAAGKALHLMGLLSDGGVHSHMDHLYALLDMAQAQGFTRIYVHIFLDGRDVPPSSALEYIEALNGKLEQMGVGTIATVSGRYYAMDRDRRWERVEKAYGALVYGRGNRATSPREAVELSYSREITDEFVVPTVIVDEQGEPLCRVENGDALIFFNFRADRARELTRAFVDKEFEGFDRGENPPRVHFVCLTQYDITIQAPVAFPPQDLTNTLGEVLSQRGIRQLRIAETEKYAHVTFFFNGGVEAPNTGEDRILIPSPKVATYNLKPEMSAPEVTDTVLEKIAAGTYPVIIMNFANPDMVGHTGDLQAAIEAVEAVDRCLGRIGEAVRAKGGTVLVVADHGNVEMMQDPETGQPLTAHTTDLVPCILISDRHKGVTLRRGGALKDVAPTMLELLGVAQPAEMTGLSLILK